VANGSPINILVASSARRRLMTVEAVIRAVLSFGDFGFAARGLE